MSQGNDKQQGERFTGHGAEWRNSNLSSEDARAATAWVEQRIDKRSMLTDKGRVEDVRDLGRRILHAEEAERCRSSFP